MDNTKCDIFLRHSVHKNMLWIDWLMYRYITKDNDDD